MLHRYIDKFLDYCRLADFSIRSVQALTARLNEFDTFLNKQRIRSVKKVSYRHLVGFVADYKVPYIHVTKSRVWAMRQFTSIERKSRMPQIQGVKGAAVIFYRKPLTTQ